MDLEDRVSTILEEVRSCEKQRTLQAQERVRQASLDLLRELGIEGSLNPDWIYKMPQRREKPKRDYDSKHARLFDAGIATYSLSCGALIASSGRSPFELVTAGFFGAWYLRHSLRAAYTYLPSLQEAMRSLDEKLEKATQQFGSRVASPFILHGTKSRAQLLMKLYGPDADNYFEQKAAGLSLADRHNDLRRFRDGTSERTHKRILTARTLCHVPYKKKGYFSYFSDVAALCTIEKAFGLPPSLKELNKELSRAKEFYQEQYTNEFDVHLGAFAERARMICQVSIQLGEDYEEWARFLDTIEPIENEIILARRQAARIRLFSGGPRDQEPALFRSYVEAYDRMVEIPSP